MYKLLLLSSSYTLVTLLALSQASELGERQNCAASYSACNPAGASTTSVPSIGTGLSQIYVDLLDSISGITAKKRDVITPPDSLQPRSSPGLCCVSGTDCLLLHNLAIPFCYDRFTTDFSLPDGSYGTLDSFTYTSPSEGTVNLLLGNYTLTNGTTGSIYDSTDPPPNTSTLTLPIPFTSSGIGSAIPASALGAEATYTVTVPGTTIPATTIPAEVISTPQVISTADVVGSSTIVVGTTVTVAETEPASTVPGTTVPGTTYTVTSYLPAGTAATSSTSTAVAGFLTPLPAVIEIGVSLVGALLAIFA